MQYLTFHDQIDLSIAFLAYDLDADGMLRNYVTPYGKLSNKSEPEKEVIGYKLPFLATGAKKNKRKAVPVKEQREYFQELLPMLQQLGIKYIVVAQPDYFKTLTGSKKAAAEVGTIFHVDEKEFSDFIDMKVLYAPNYKMAFYDPEKTKLGIETTLQSLIADQKGSYVAPGSNIIKFRHHPVFLDEIEETLEFLLDLEKDLSADIEGYSLDFHDAYIGSISFAWGENEGISFLVDPAPGIKNYRVRTLLEGFFERLFHPDNKQKLIWHNAAYDVTVLIYQLSQHKNKETEESLRNWFFDHFTDPKKVDDTKIISYLATNSCAGNKLSLKDQAVEFAGNYAIEEIKDITKISPIKLLEYNLVDALSTHYVRNKNYPKMVEDKQEEVYKEIFLPALVDVIDMQLNGLPVDMEQVHESEKELQAIYDSCMDTIQNLSITKEYTHFLKEQEVEKLHAKWKKKRTSVDEIDLVFNPNSDQQLRGILYSKDYMNLPVLALTDSGAPSTKGKLLKDLQHFAQTPEISAFLNAICELKDCAILLSTFIPALKGARKGADGNYYMHGNFNLGGTLSGRLSSSDPNLQNLPSGSRLAKFIKKCIKAALGWLFIGVDFDSLEDKISALITKDPNKLKVYTDGYDGHSLRALTYFAEKMPNIDPTSVESVNSIADLYPEERQRSKAPTFLLTYGGTYHGLKSNCGFSETEALNIESNYHALYKVSDDWVAEKIDYASNNGYVEVAFGLRVRTPILEQTVLTEKHTPYAAKAEARTAGNALGQSWGLLNNRAASAFMKKVRQSGFRNKIKICCQIHDAQYYLVKAEAEVVHWMNKALLEEIAWQEHPAIQHPEVKLSGQLGIFYPDWSKEHQIPKDATLEDIQDLGRTIVENMKVAA